MVYLPVFLDFRRLLIIGAYSEFERLGLQDFCGAKEMVTEEVMAGFVNPCLSFEQWSPWGDSDARLQIQ